MKGTLRVQFLAMGIAALLAAPAWAAVCDNPDADGDGHDAIACGGDDCDDYDPDRYPGNVEVCDVSGRDEDCDATTFGFLDMDGDGFANENCCNEDVDGTFYCGDDCDDRNRSSHPIANDVCDGRDNDCDGVIDQHAGIQFADADRDGHGNPAESMGRVCPGTEGFSPLSNDCDDSNPAIEPGDLVCDPSAGPDGYLYCGSDGQWVSGNACDEGSVCVAQANGTGVCIPDKVKDKDKDKA